MFEENDVVKSTFGRHEEIFWSNGKRVSFMRSFINFGAPISMPDTDYKSASDRGNE